MDKTIIKICTNQYINKAELKQCLPNCNLDETWKNIMAYRSNFYTRILLGKQVYLIALTSFVVNKIMKVNIAISKIIRYKYVENLPMILIANTIYSETIHFNFIETQKKQINNKKEFLENALKSADINCVPNDFIELTLNDNIPILVRLFMIQCIGSDTIRIFMVTNFLMINDLLQAFALLIDHKQIANIKRQTIDLTYQFGPFLDTILVQVEQNMLSYIYNNKDNKTIKSSQLLLKYPQLSKEQAQFYENNRKCGYYYTISQYMDKMHVCYETARYSLEQLVTMGWYQKQKIGKKFVYFVV